MKQPFSVTSVLSKVNLPKVAVENDVNRRNKIRSESGIADVLLPGFENVLWRFMNVPVKGNIELVFKNNHNGHIKAMDIPATTWFLAACTKSNKGAFELAGGMSLS